MRYALLVLLLFFAQPYFGQNTIENLVIEKVNHLRDSLDLKPLKQDTTLLNAAEDHSYYLKVHKKLSHFQKTFTKETASERVAFYQGNRTYIGENIADVSFKSIKEVSDAKGIAQKLFDGWLNSPKHYENMVNPAFTKMALAYSFYTKRSLYAVQLFSSDEIRLPKAFRNSDLAWGVRPAEVTCKDKAQTYETMFFANSVQIVGNSIYFYFHDREFFKNVIRNDNDGLAVDIILREQLPCEKENQFHISAVHDGEMQRPIYKNDIYRNDIANNPRKIKIKIGEVPEYLQNKEWEANIIVINDNKLCDYSYPIEVPHAIYPLLDVNPYYDYNDRTDSAISTPIIHLKDSVHVELDYKRGEKIISSKTESEFDRMLTLVNYINKAKVDCYASVEGASWFNEQLLEERKKTVKGILFQTGFHLDNLEINAKENWDLMYAQIERNSLSILKGKSKPEIKKYLKTYSNNLLDSLLFEQRKTHITVNIDTVLNIQSHWDWSAANYFDSTLSMNILPWNKLLREDFIIPKIVIRKEIVDSLVDDYLLRTNLLGTASIRYSPSILDSISVQRLIDSVDERNTKQLFNYAHFLTKYWYYKYSRSYETVGVAKSISPEKLWKLVANIDSTQISSKDLNRLQVNILLSGIHYYVTHNNWNWVENYFEKIANLVKLDNFTTEEAEGLALFCNHFHKFKPSVNILKPFYEKKLLSEDGYFLLAKTSALIQDELPQEHFRAYMATAKNANHKRYCDWLNTSFQIQRNEYIKNEYCSECL